MISYLELVNQFVNNPRGISINLCLICDSKSNLRR